jgi:hypothetical protein
MRTSLIETQQIESYLLMPTTEDQLVIEARMILDPTLCKRIQQQKKAYSLIQQYSRKKLRAEIEEVHQKLFRDSEHEGFRQKIFRLFSTI